MVINMCERIPEFLVRVEYEDTLTKNVRSIYFEDYGEKLNHRYKRGLKAFHPNSKIRKIERRVKPVVDSSC